MSEPVPSPTPYRVIPSGHVSNELRALSQRAIAAGFREPFLDALRTLQRVLSIYPQFGDQLRDLTTVGETVHAATFPPLFVEYIIDEPNRAVFIVVPIKVMPHSGFQ